MTDPTPKYVWVISGPGREYDYCILPHDDELKWVEAKEFAFKWLEDIMDEMDVDGPELGIEVRLRSATESDLAILREESDELDD